MMDDAGDFLVLRSPLVFEYHAKVCLAMKVDVQSTAEELHHVVLERCRCVLFTCSGEVLVSPQSDHFLLICDPALLEAEQFKRLAGKISLVEAWSSPVTSQVLAECLSYTLSARLAPEWNKVGGWLLQGRKFLHQAEPLNAVKMKVNVANERVEVSLAATKVSFPLINPGDLGVDEDLLATFLQDDEGSVLTQRDFGQRTLHVLPRLNRAQLISISKRIPACPEARLTTWTSMKNYWMNIHGYRLGLEETDEPQIFYNLTYWDGLTFTYPEWTVRLAEPRPVPGTDPRPILDDFIKDLLAFNKLVLGRQFCLEAVPEVSPSYGRAEAPPAPTAPSRREQQEPKFPSSQAAARGLSSLADFTENQWRKVGAPVKARTMVQDSGYPTSVNRRSTTTLPMTANRMKPSFMMNVATKGKKTQLKPSRPRTKITRPEIIPNYNPFACENDPEVKASIAKAQAKAAAQWKLSQKLLVELCTEKEEKKKEKKSDEVDLQFLAF